MNWELIWLFFSLLTTLLPLKEGSVQTEYLFKMGTHFILKYSPARATLDYLLLKWGKCIARLKSEEGGFGLVVDNFFFELYRLVAISKYIHCLPLLYYITYMQCFYGSVNILTIWPFPLINSWVDNIKAYSSSFLHVIIAHNHLPFLKIF